jgi:hypothetical protein
LSAPPIELYDTDVLQLEAILKDLRDRYQQQRRNYNAFELEARERFAAAGFLIDIGWYKFAAGGEVQDGAMPEITVVGRCEAHAFDHDQQVHEVTANILELPDQDAGEVIKTDRGDAFKKFREQGGDHGHSHSHGHPH